jgi:hypothetical protein
MRARTTVAAIAAAALSLLPACSGSTPNTTTQPSRVVESLTISGARTLVEGERVTLVVTVKWSTGATETPASGVTWVSDDARIATVDQQGVVTAVTAGEARIRATFSSVTGTIAFRVSGAPRAVTGAVHESFPTEKTIVAGATVTGVDSEGNKDTAVTDASGRFTLRLVPGTALLTVSASGYDTLIANADLSAELSVSLVPGMRVVREGFDYIYPPPANFIESRTFRFNVHRTGDIRAGFGPSWESASAQAHTCLEIRDSGNRTLAQARGQYDISAGPISVTVQPGIYEVKFSSCTPFGGPPIVSLAGFGGEVTHPS